MKYQYIIDAAANNDYDAIVELLKSPDPLKCYVNYKERQTDYTALIYAIENQNIKMIELLLDNGAEVFDDDYDILEIAKETCNDDIIRLILSYQENVKL